MSREIEKYLNQVSYNGIDNPHWMFSGDGNGDFEERSSRATKKVLEDYLLYLEEQHKLTLKAIDEFYTQGE